MTWPAASAELNLSLDGKSVPIPMHLPWRGPDVELVAWLKAIPRPELVPQSERRAGEGALGLNRPDEATIGRDAEENRLYVGDADERHCICMGVEPQGAGAAFKQETHGSAPSWHYWVIDHRSQTGTFVNRRPIIAARLLGGDVVQVGPSQWIFNETDGFLLPLGCDSGAALVVGGLEIPGRLSVPSLYVKAGEFVSVVGESGSGKSTLLKVLAGEVSPGKNCIYVNDGNGEYDIEIDRDRYRSILGYLSQEAIVHKELTPLEILRFSAQLRKGKHDRGKSRETLRRLRVRESRWQSPLHELSGGEQQRVRIASELVAEPLILLFDEPASGLDREHEKQLARSLQRLSWTGCTVIMVTHGEEIDLCDRVLHFRKKDEGRSVGEIDFDGTPSEYRRWDGKSHLPVAPSAPKKTEPQRLNGDSNLRPRIRWRPGALSQFRRLFQREWRLLAAESWKRLVLPLVIVPALFAGAFTLAFTDPAKTDLLAFFCVMASIWMGASQSLMAIVGEREVFEHERLLFLRIPPYVTAKMIIYTALAIVQSAVFLALLIGFQRSIGSPVRLFGPVWVFLCLALVNASAVGMGLVISALSGRSQQTANLLLPLVMIAQIVFSVYVCCDKGHLEDVYGRLQPRMCSMWRTQRADMWMPTLGWTCQGARKRLLGAAYKLRNQINAVGLSDQQYADIRKSFPRDPPTDSSDPTNVPGILPNSWVSVMSYFTLSRFGDIALRAFALDDESFRAFQPFFGRPVANPLFSKNPALRFGYTKWWQCAMASLGIAMLLFPAAAASILWLQTGRYWPLAFRRSQDLLDASLSQFVAFRKTMPSSARRAIGSRRWGAASDQANQ